LLDVLSLGDEGASVQSLSEIWSVYSEKRTAGATPFVAAVHVAARVDRLGFAFAAGYPAALQHLVADVSLPCALCVTEAGGNHPRAIQTTLERAGDGFVLRGSKSFVTLGDLAADLVIAARAGDKPDGLPDLAVVRIPRDRAGIELTAHPPTPFAPEVPHARLELRGVEVRPEERLPGDGYLDYVKPFRTIEDIHVLGAAVGYLIGVAVRCMAPSVLVATLVSALAALDRLSLEPPLSPSAHIALHGVIQQLMWLTQREDFARLWQAAPEPERVRWKRDQALLQVASKAREARFQAATRRLALGSTRANLFRPRVGC
jgi:hypothetical protein